MTDYLRIFSRRAAAATAQSLPIPGTVPNSAGGHAFPVDDWARLDRFLILGSEAGSYYASERTLTRDNALATQRAIASDGPRAVARIVELSEAGRAPRNDPALLALALAALPRVALTGAHLLAFAGLVEGTRGWGRALRRAVAAWYAEPPVERLAYQLVKYRQRNGWSHRDLLRLAHPVTDGPRAALLDWVCRGTDSEALPALVRAAMALARAETGTDAAALIRAHDLPREAVPTTLLDDPAVWEALLGCDRPGLLEPGRESPAQTGCDRPGSLEPGRESPAQKIRMPLHALVRSLAKLTTVGVVRPLGDALPLVLSALADADRIARARLHPLAILLALRTYAQGHGDRGSLTWEPVQAVVDALNAAFYTAFRSVEPTGRRLLLALDVSGSMAAGRVAGSSLTPREASAAMALMTAATEPHTHIVGFGAEMVPLGLSPSMRLDDAVRAVSGLPFANTDCAQPMLYALQHGIRADAFVIYTDSETWAGAVHPVQALRQYRERTGIAAKLVVVGLVSNGFSIADPDDAGMMDVVGFDTATPAIIADFIRH